MLYLIDFEEIGAVFKPEATGKNKRDETFIHGKLHLHDRIYQVILLVRRDKFIQIYKVCGDSQRNAATNLRDLKKSRAEAIAGNVNGLRDRVRTRRLRAVLWYFSFITNLAIQFLGMAYTLMIGFAWKVFAIVFISYCLNQSLLLRKMELLFPNSNKKKW